jgi:glycerophosphoryl diester phosphodiesterase
MRLAILFVLAGIALGSADAKRIAVIAHRGEHLDHPENTLAGFQAAAEIGADFFECDVRTTKDGRLVLMHDRGVERTTDGKGDIAEMTFAEVRALTIQGGDRVPAFEEALALAKKSGIGIYADVKAAYAAPLVEAIRRSGMEDRVVIYGGPKLHAGIVKLAPLMKVMPEASNAPFVREMAATIKPRVFAFDARDFTDELVGMVRKLGAAVYVDRLGAADNPQAWEAAVKRGADGIQTDRPADLIRFLVSKGWR